VLNICSDTNYKIRTDGAIFFKNYLQQNNEVLISTSLVRLQETYIPELIELCNDEEIFIRIEAIEAITYVVEQLDTDIIDREIIQPLLKILLSDHDEIIERASAIVGRMVYKLSLKDSLHLKYQDDFVEFYKQTCASKNSVCR
jgi:HEAT repeat protein